MRTGIRRKVDDLGRIVIPAGIRRSLGIHVGDPLEFHVEGEQVILARPSETCVFCGEEERVEEFRGRPVCATCLEQLGTRLAGGQARAVRGLPARGGSEPPDAPTGPGQAPPESTTAW